MVHDHLSPNNTKKCCKRVGTSFWGTYYCVSCNNFSCYFHIALWTSYEPRCYFCFSPARCIAAPKAIPWENNTNIPDHYRKVLIIIDGFYIAGMQRHCLELIDVFNDNRCACIVLTLNGAGGKWADRFLSKSRQLILSLDDNLTWAKLQNIAGFVKFEFVVAHLTSPIRWTLKNVPHYIRAFAFFHSEPSEHEFISVDELLMATRRFEALLFPSHTTLRRYQLEIERDRTAILDVEKWKVLPNGIPRLTQDESAIKQNEKSTKELLHIAVISRIDRDKFSIHLFTKTLKYLLKRAASFKVFIAGNGECMKELRDSLDGAGISDFVSFLGFVDSKISEVYAWADVIFLPSKREAMPYVMLESLKYKRPIVIPRVGVLKEFEMPGVIYSFEPENAHEAALLILQAAIDASKVESLITTSSVARCFPNYENWTQLVKECYRL